MNTERLVKKIGDEPIVLRYIRDQCVPRIQMVRGYPDGSAKAATLCWNFRDEEAANRLIFTDDDYCIAVNLDMEKPAYSAT